jgi:catechol 2,3-dioxygenase-like lactoylglutathione lyase family enzyme
MTIGKTAKNVAYAYTRDPARAIAFYGKTLGLPQKSQDKFATVLDLYGAELRIVEIKDHKPHAHPVFGWEVPDVVATVKSLKANGVTMNVYDGMGQDELGIWTSPDGKTKIAFFNDPDGNGLSIATHI